MNSPFWAGLGVLFCILLIPSLIALARRLKCWWKILGLNVAAPILLAVAFPAAYGRLPFIPSQFDELAYIFCLVAAVVMIGQWLGTLAIALVSKVEAVDGEAAPQSTSRILAVGGVLLFAFLLSSLFARVF